MRTGRVIIVTVTSLALAAVLGATAVTPALQSRRAAASIARRRVDRAIAEYRDLMSRHPEWVESSSPQFVANYSQLPAAKQVRHLPELVKSLGELRSRMIVHAGGNDTYRTFSPNGFRDFYDGFSYPNSRGLANAPGITGDEGADQRIRLVAEARGYRLRSAAVEGLLISRGRHRLQAPVWEAWDALRLAAARDGVSLDLVSAYRSPDRQRDIFVKRLRNEAEKVLGRPFTVEDIASGGLDDVLDKILATSSIPGYSKHHSGYTIDITDADSGLAFTDFGRTAGFRWMSSGNYHNAKKFGFVPSYPEGAIDLGPDPEPWEYVWVGERMLLAAPDAKLVDQS